MTAYFCYAHPRTCVRQYEGSAEVLGIDARRHPERIRERTGVLPEGYGFDDYLTGREYVEWTIGSREADDDPDEILETVGIADDPDLLVLDEPSTGLDPNGIQQMRSVVRERADAGTTVVSLGTGGYVLSSKG